MFSIAHTDAGNRLATIQIGDFVERFVTESDRSPSELDGLWHAELEKFRDDTKTVVLPVWLSSGHVTRAWIAYKIGARVHVQDRLFPEGFSFREDRPPDGAIRNEDGERISEWSTSLESVLDFLKSENAEPRDPPNDGPATSVDNSDASGGGRHR